MHLLKSGKRKAKKRKRTATGPRSQRVAGSERGEYSESWLQSARCAPGRRAVRRRSVRIRPHNLRKNVHLIPENFMLPPLLPVTLVKKKPEERTG